MIDIKNPHCGPFLGRWPWTEQKPELASQQLPHNSGLEFAFKLLLACFIRQELKLATQSFCPGKTVTAHCHLLKNSFPEQVLWSLFL